MDDKIVAVMVWTIVISFFVILYLMDRRVKTRGALFAGPATPLMRLLALLLGIVFAILVFDSFEIMWLILAITLISYGLGMGGLLTRLQANDSTATDSAPGPVSQNEVPALPTARPGVTMGRILSLLVRWALRLAVAGGVIYAAWWAWAHPGEEGPILTIFVLGFLVMGLAGVVHNIKSIVDLIERLMD